MTGEPDDEQRATFDAADETLLKSALRRARAGAVPLIAGGVLFAWAVRARRRGGSGAGQVITGAALVALGLRRRRSSSGLPDAAEIAIREIDSDGNAVSDEPDAAGSDGADQSGSDEGSGTEREW
ncbi:hypothetical protein G9464_04340 [Halostella sp. JP-L12]|uniref:hypothetical protein n=1 Tax=Halostella TaxID=1843185 RepID=UPI000EF7F0B8|nr:MULTISPECIES: hypothetical protein [Halostella]NHN46824.1 hypothetical protein [Halostella sp. JP-L12]